MTTPIAYSVPAPGHATITASIGQSYRTKKPIVAVHFNPSQKGEIVFLEEGVKLRVIGPSCCLREGFEVISGNESYNIFEVDLLARCAKLAEPVRIRAA